MMYRAIVFGIGCGALMSVFLYAAGAPVWWAPFEEGDGRKDLLILLHVVGLMGLGVSGIDGLWGGNDG